MNQQIILLTDANTAPAVELIESLSSTGISVSSQDLSEASPGSVQPTPHPLVLLYEVGPELRVEDLRLVVERASGIWPGVSILACRRQLARPSARNRSAPDNATLKRLGFRAVADNPAQLPALLRQLEDMPDTGEFKPPPGFKRTPDSRMFSLPAAVRGHHLRGALALLASLHLASNQKEAGQVALAGVARLVPADRWAIFLLGQTSSPDAVAFEPLIARSFSGGGSLSFDKEWQLELLNDADPPSEPESKAAHEAATRIEAVRKVESGRRVIALPLVSGETVLGVLEGIRDDADEGAFSRSEAALLAALVIPIASALANSVRIAEAELLSLTDDLTKLHNARYLRQFLVNEIKRARRYDSNIAALFLDLDDFKRVNDKHGHLVGSHALMEVASVILPSVRDTDCVVRYGGDEFVVILPETKIDEAIRVADRIRAKIEHHPFTGGRRLKLFFTASFGIALFPQHAASPQQLIACADTAMYQAKAAGKNCLRIVGGGMAIDPDDGRDSSLAGPTQFQRIPDEKLIS
jgi:diguanylate cyclase (GGDEF)-like protein